MVTDTQAENAATTDNPPPTDAPKGPTSEGSQAKSFFDPAEAERLFEEQSEAPATEEASPEAQPTAPEATSPESEQEAQPAGEQPPTEQPAQSTEEAKPERILPGRISTGQFNEYEQQAIALKRKYSEAGENISLPEAFQILDRQNQQAREAAEAAAQEEAAKPDPVAALEAEIEEIKAKIAQATEDGVLYTKDIADLHESLSDKKADLRDARQQKKADEAAAQSRKAENAQASFEPSRQQALKEYPSLSDNNSPLYGEVVAEINRRNNPQHPLHYTLQDVNVPLSVAREVAEQYAERTAKLLGLNKADVLGKLRATASAPTVQQPAAPQTPAPATKPATPAPQPASAKDIRTAPGSQTAAQPVTVDVKQALKGSLTNRDFDYDSVLFPSTDPMALV